MEGIITVVRVIEYKHRGIHLRDSNDPVRSPGIHLSGIIRAVALEQRLLKSNEDSEDLDTMIGRTDPSLVGDNSRLMLVALGYAWEEYMAKRIPNMIHQPGGIECEGIHMTPDGIEDVPGHPPVIHEFKLTTTSSRKPIEEHVLWMWQAAGYLKGLSKLLGIQCTQVVFHPCHLRGDYTRTGPQWPLYRPEMIAFEPEEIESYWGMMVKNKYKAVPEKGTNVQN